MLNNKFGKYPCPCCGFYTMDRQADNTFQTCEVCYWEDDGVQLDDPDYEGGANEESLNQARANYKAFGAAKDHCRKFVRPPKEDELPD